LAAGLVAVGGCALDTDLTDEPPPGGAATSLGPGGAGLVDPMPGASDVAPNLAAVVVRFAAAVNLGPGALTICHGPTGDIRSGSDAQPVGCAGVGTCYRVSVIGALPPGATCSVAVAMALARDDGQMVSTGLVGQFDTAAAPDQTPPKISALTAQPVGGCLGATFATDEPTQAELVLQVGEATVSVAAGAPAVMFDLATSTRGLPPDSDGTLLVRATDRAGNVAMSEPLPIHTPPAALPLVITEVRPNPAGKEPDQEFVELRNIGPEPINLGGLRIEDSRGGDVLPAAELRPGAYALVVAAAFDPADVKDVGPLAGTTLVRLESRIGSDGLTNSGEVVRLRGGATADAPLLSSYGGWVDTSATAWSGKSVHRATDDACDRPGNWNRIPLMATPGWGLP
jgi:hypothetical protein